ncbi:hypothetical protein HZU83_21775 [Sphaerotilus montanus]|uniref:Uncharacterized protein n=1 Tax=Sphaerotilus montanus TaxID=522889 RepID=A0A7Y9U880_9BURK|nr:hypothetical protein [Sphaerotilus montanus]NYG34316.1 hypothetical protein [Sphaerotilus montanus]NZD59313.1 hypothetical protein [Sphaerotilus montanus]
MFKRMRMRVEQVFVVLSLQGGKCMRAMTLERNELATRCSARLQPAAMSAVRPSGTSTMRRRMTKMCAL